MLLPEDLARLRDIGPDDPEAYAEPVFTLSPDGRSAAFQLRQGDPAHNSYCLAMVIFDLAGNNRPRVVDLGDDPLLVTLDLRGIVDFPTGLMRVITPRWSRDGKWIAFLKRSGGTVQVWRAWADGSGSAPLTRSKSDVVDFRVGPDGSSIIFVTRPDVDRQRREIAAEGRNGWHYDERFVPFVSKAPLPKMPAERHVQVLELPRGRIRPPSVKEAAVLVEDHRIIANSGDRPVIDEAGIEIDATDLTGGARPGTFHARPGNGSTVTCAVEACDGAKSPWWMPGRDHVRFFRREGWARASTAIYDWDVVHGDVRRIYLTDDILSSCAPSGATIICRIDSSLQPGRLVRLDPRDGERETLFDPNPEFAHLTLGKAERLHFRNGMGSETIADLVFPVGYRAGEKVPMVVVQYETRGFLRGGTDDEYPIQAFANRGYAVFSFKRPQLASTLNAKDYNEVGRQNLKQFADRRNVQASLDAGVRSVIDRGIADPARIGITGLSDGSTTVEWALIHSSLFSAAAMSSCCWDSTLMAQVGPAAARHFLDEGYPGVLERNDTFWKEMTLSENARRITTPILVSASEEEFLGAVLTYTALREAGVPIDMFEFPGEFHARWQPAHRLAAYKRSLDWFDYWLLGRRSTDPARQPELKEWDRLKRDSGRGRPI
ncbi:MAG TPA: Atxe2 family lasso peptide isopeptidase [Sphingomicrobium sp.]|nr:Atxe2 family lasso peptide isopeptidase [Sphingomicrobium sp.]